jgi:trehalose 6-phosphate phosphatase
MSPMGPTPPGPLALARSALAHRPAALVTDLDGTLSPIVDDPSAARLADGAADALRSLADAGVHVVIVTGRAGVDARRMVGTDRFLIVANHGAEWLEPGRAPTASVSAGRSSAVARAVERLRLGSGMELERKGATVTIHFRNAPNPDAAHRAIRDELGSADLSGVELHPGRMSLELRPAGAPNKGEALRQVAARARLRGLVVIGDDVTDLDMFRAAAELREAGQLDAGAILAVAGGAEVPSDVGRAADAVLESPAVVVALLADLAKLLSPRHSRTQERG